MNVRCGAGKCPCQRTVVKWSDLNLQPVRSSFLGIHYGDPKARFVRDLWRQQDVGSVSDQFQTSVPRHGVVLVKVSPGK